MTLLPTDARVKRLLLSVTTLLMLTGWSLPLPAAGLVLPGAIHGGGMMTKKVVSMREARYLDLVAQKTDFSCGAAALATILRYGYGMRIDEASVIRGLLARSDPVVVREKGFSLLHLKEFVLSRGLRAHGYRVTVDALRNLKIPVIALVDVKGYRHFVVVKKTVGGRVYLADPALGHKVIPVEEFSEGWNGVVLAVVGPGFDPGTPLLFARDIPRASKTVALNGTQRALAPVDFGLIPVDLF